MPPADTMGQGQAGDGKLVSLFLKKSRNSQIPRGGGFLISGVRGCFHFVLACLIPPEGQKSQQRIPASRGEASPGMSHWCSPGRRGHTGGGQQRAHSHRLHWLACEKGLLGCSPPPAPSASLCQGSSAVQRESYAQPRLPGPAPTFWLSGGPLPTGTVPLAPAETAAKVKIGVKRKFIYLFN